MLVPAGTNHKIINTGNVPLMLYTIKKVWRKLQDRRNLCSTVESQSDGANAGTETTLCRIKNPLTPKKRETVPA